MKMGYVLGVCLALAACASAPTTTTAGTKISDSDLKTLRPGVTTLDEVKAKFGEPNQVIDNSDGTIELLYAYAETTTSSESGITSYLKRMNPFGKPEVVDTKGSSALYDLAFKGGKFWKYRVTSNSNQPAKTN